MYRIVLVFSLLMAGSALQDAVGQELDRTWSRIYDSGAEDHATAIGVTSGGDAYVAGWNRVQGTSLLVLRVGSDSSVQWSTRIRDELVDWVPPLLAVDSNDHAVVAGYSYGELEGSFIASVADGDTVWTRYLHWDTYPKALEVSGSRIYVASDWDYGPWMPQLQVFSTDGDYVSGNIVWTSGSHYITDMCIDNNLVFTTGHFERQTITTAVMDASSSELSWLGHTGLGNEAKGVAVLTEPYTDVAVIGNIEIRGDMDIWVGRHLVHPGFAEPFELKTIDIAGADDLAVAAASGASGIVLAGTTGSASRDVLIGEVGSWDDWFVTYDGPTSGDDAGIDVGVLPTGEFVVMARVAGTSGSDQALLLYSADGQLLDATIDVGVDDPIGLAIAPAGAIYTVGNSAGGNIVVNRYVTSPAGIEPAAVPATLRVGSPQPNPTSGAVVLPYELSEDGDVRAGIYDVSGRLVRSLVSGRQARGPHELAWDGLAGDGGAVASGVYFVRIDLGNRVERRRVVMTR